MQSEDLRIQKYRPQTHNAIWKAMCDIRNNGEGEWERGDLYNDHFPTADSWIWAKDFITRKVQNVQRHEGIKEQDL